MPHIRDDETVAFGLLLSDLGVLDRENADICGVTVKTIRRWRRDYQRLGRSRLGAHAQMPCPRCLGTLDEALYADVLGLYLGDGHLALARRGVYRLDIACAAHTGDFRRGLFHSDGCRTTNRVRRVLRDGERWYEYPRYFFSNESRDILRLFGNGLDRLGIAWRYSRPNTISVARRDAVAASDQCVGPKY